MLGSVCLDLSPTSDVAEAPRKQLKRNLAAFDLEIDEVVSDGDCAFASKIKRLHKAVPNMTKDAKAPACALYWFVTFFNRGRLRSASNVC